MQTGELVLYRPSSTTTLSIESGLGKKEREREKLTKINVDSVSDKQHHFEMVLKSFIERGGLWSGIKNRAHTHTHMIYTENKKYFASIRGKILSSYE